MSTTGLDSPLSFWWLSPPLLPANPIAQQGLSGLPLAFHDFPAQCSFAGAMPPLTQLGLMRAASKLQKGPVKTLVNKSLSGN